MNITIEKWKKWEYWPSYMFYFPLIPYFIYLAIKARHTLFFSTVNPGIEGGGMGFESKYATLMLIPEDLRPWTLFVELGQDIDQVIEQINKSNICYPLIVKPDVGFRGILVVKIKKESELRKYYKSTITDTIIQNYVPGDYELGVFYHRLPNESKGKITSLTQKVYLKVIGDGTSTIKKLMGQSENDQLFIDLVIQKHDKGFIKQIPRKGEKVILSYIGNHSKGATLVNINNQISDELCDRLDQICDRIDGWNYGRLDLKVPSLSDFIDGSDIRILEINGVIGEPTHIYDSEAMNYFSAIREIAKHWSYIYDVSKELQKNNTPSYGIVNMSKEILDLLKLKKKLEKIAKV